MKTLAGAVTASTVALAGCGGDGGAAEPPTAAGSEYPAADEWLTETDVDGAADNYDGAVADSRGENEIMVAVGAEGNDGNLAFDPPAVAVAPGTEVRWLWTGLGGQHNVLASRDVQMGETDVEFESGEPVDAEDEEFTYTVEETGTALYHCESHVDSGMKEAVVVEDGQAGTPTGGAST